MLPKGHAFFEKWGVWAIFIGRFFGPLRAFVPLMAGLLQMRRRTFQVANIVSAAVWVLAILAPGYFAAKGLAELEALSEADLITVLIATAVAVSLAGFAAWRILKATEAEFGVSLVSRDGARGSSLTEDARRLLELYYALNKRAREAVKAEIEARGL